MIKTSNGCRRLFPGPATTWTGAPCDGVLSRVRSALGIYTTIGLNLMLGSAEALEVLTSTS